MLKWKTYIIKVEINEEIKHPSKEIANGRQCVAHLIKSIYYILKAQYGGPK
jgi:hypothetical protein